MSKIKAKHLTKWHFYSIMPPANLNSCHIGSKERTVENQTNTKPVIVMPAIYRLPRVLPDTATIERWGSVSLWGWHRAVELLAAVKNMLLLRDGHDFSPEPLQEAISRVNPGQPLVQNSRASLSGYLTVLNDNVTVRWRHTESLWLLRCVEDDLFIPSKIGMKLIKAIKHPLISRLI